MPLLSQTLPTKKFLLKLQLRKSTRLLQRVLFIWITPLAKSQPSFANSTRLNVVFNAPRSLDRGVLLFRSNLHFIHWLLPFYVYNKHIVLQKLRRHFTYEKVLKVIGIIAAVAGAIFGVYVIVKNMLTAKSSYRQWRWKLCFMLLLRRQLRFRNRCVNKNVL